MCRSFWLSIKCLAERRSRDFSDSESDDGAKEKGGNGLVVLRRHERGRGHGKKADRILSSIHAVHLSGQLDQDLFRSQYSDHILGHDQSPRTHSAGRGKGKEVKTQLKSFRSYSQSCKRYGFQTRNTLSASFQQPTENLSKQPANHFQKQDALVNLGR